MAAILVEVEQQWLLLSRGARVELDPFARLCGSRSLCKSISATMAPSLGEHRGEVSVGKGCISSSFLRS